MAKGKATDTKIISRLLSSTPEQAKDTGMAMVLICLLLGYFGKFPKFLPVSIVLLLITMAWPKAFKPLAGLWFGLSHVMGQVVSGDPDGGLFRGGHPRRPDPAVGRGPMPCN